MPGVVNDNQADQNNPAQQRRDARKSEEKAPHGKQRHRDRERGVSRNLTRGERSFRLRFEVVLVIQEVVEDHARGIEENERQGEQKHRARLGEPTGERRTCQNVASDGRAI